MDIARSWVRRRAAPGASAACAWLLAACAAGPDYVPPAPPAAAGYTPQPLAVATASAAVEGGEAQQFVPGGDIPKRWWTLFQSPALDALIDRALGNSPTLAAAEAALRQAQEAAYAQEGAYYPSLDANFSSSRQKVATGSVTTSAASGASLYYLHTAQLSIAYTPDVFGGNRRQLESLRAQVEVQRFQLEAAHLTLAASLVVAAVQEASLRGQIDATNALIQLQQEQLELTRRQFDLGAVPQAGILAQEAQLALARAALPPLMKQLAQQRNQIAALSGRGPGDPPPELFSLALFKLPQRLPLSLPSTLVAQRPDVRSAEAQLHAASAQIGVAQANRLPQFSIAASGGNMATQIGRLFDAGNGFWSLAAGLTQPIFDGGTLLHRQRAAEAAYEQAAAQYRLTVIAALQNVADTLQALSFDAAALQEAARAASATAASLSVARRQVELGDISYLALLAAEQAYQQALMGQVQAQAYRYADTAALFAALGGGWWNAPGPAPAMPAMGAQHEADLGP